jgi:hypothetical protein
MTRCQHCTANMVGDICQTCGNMQAVQKTIGHRDVAQLAKDTVLDVMAENDGRHGMAWLTRHDSIDIRHIRKHLELYEARDETDSHLHNVLTRVAMMLARKT